MVSRSMVSPCAAHSSATAFASAALDTASGPARRGAHGLAVERDAVPAVGFHCLRSLVETLRLGRVHGASSKGTNSSPAGAVGEAEKAPSDGHVRRQRGGEDQRQLVAGPRQLQRAGVKVQARLEAGRERPPRRHTCRRPRRDDRRPKRCVREAGGCGPCAASARARRGAGRRFRSARSPLSRAGRLRRSRPPARHHPI